MLRLALKLQVNSCFQCCKDIVSICWLFMFWGPSSDKMYYQTCHVKSAFWSYTWWILQVSPKFTIWNSCDCCVTNLGLTPWNGQWRTPLQRLCHLPKLWARRSETSSYVLTSLSQKIWEKPNAASEGFLLLHLKIEVLRRSPNRHKKK